MGILRCFTAHTRHASLIISVYFAVIVKLNERSLSQVRVVILINVQIWTHFCGLPKEHSPAHKQKIGLKIY